MTFEELRRLAKQTNWEKSRLLFLLLKNIVNIMDEDDYLNGYVKHLFNDENNELEIYIVTAKERFISAKYLYEQKTVQIHILETADIESLLLTETESKETELQITFSSGMVIVLNNRENFDQEHKNYVTGFARTLVNL